ncbi:phosphoribosylglycinamide formyltransferase [Filifactor alocis]|uniref:phosphoribosylglycinamide formyltransferase n=1 Tax=Filifactor alocis TaxID=143361 RepID=UPI0028D2C0CE|nr:phosphoribosylglycinamide formyltransferase [Filifactor alocis]
MSSSVRRIAVFVSGGGTNLQSLLDAEQDKFFQSKICLVISNREDAYALERAKNYNVPAFVLKSENEILDKLSEYDIDTIVLAGYLRILGTTLLKEYQDRIINIHPSLLPKYGGKGMYGLNVHRAVFEHKEKESGATVHFVNETVDGGKILIQESISIEGAVSPEEIQKIVLDVEHRILKEAILKLEEENLEESIIKCYR